MHLNVKGHGAEEFTRVLLRAWECDPRERIRFRVEIAADQGVLAMNSEIKQITNRRGQRPGQTSKRPGSFIYDLLAGEPEALLVNLSSFADCRMVRLRMISRPSNVEIALLNRAELQALARNAAAEKWRALLPFIFPVQSEWLTDILLGDQEDRFIKCPAWLSASEVKRILVQMPQSAGNLRALRCAGLEAELPPQERPRTVIPALASQVPPKSSLANCPQCHGQTEMNGDGRLACHFCGHVFHPGMSKVPVPA